ncbi:MAG: nucleotidyltransferase family protein [Lachnospiraceae bacterium]|nr:nucleotidyltransferase family protein [Lachnospiraceae bacterium]
MNTQKIVGIIAEFNPFHNGHEYLIKQARERFGDDTGIVIVMSGNFVQRGTPALLSKEIRTECALLGGADLVIELPIPAACGSAEYFAGSAITLLSSMGCVSDILFGSESGDLEALCSIARFLATEDPAYQAALKEGLKNGLSFPKARMQAIGSACGDPSIDPSLLMLPNNILAIEYLKAMIRLQAPFEAHTIQRCGQGYHADAASFSGEGDLFLSAEQIRLAIAEHLPAYRYAQAMPAYAATRLDAEVAHGRILSMEDLSDALLSRLQFCSKEELLAYQDMTEDLAIKILNKRFSASLLPDLIGQLKSRDLTYTRISRMLLHVLLEITKEEVKQGSFLSYLKVLGFRKSQARILTAIKECSTLPLITQYHEVQSLPATIRDAYEKDAARDGLCALLRAAKESRMQDTEVSIRPQHPYTTQLIILS